MFSGSVLLSLERITKMGVNFFIIAVISRHFGPEKFGLYSYSIACLAFVGVVVNFGIDNLVLKNLSSSNNTMILDVLSVFTLRFVLFLVTSLISFVLHLVYYDDVSFLIISILYAFTCILSTSETLQLFKENYITITVAKLTIFLVCILVKIIFLAMNVLSIKALLFIFIFEILLANIYFLYNMSHGSVVNNDKASYNTKIVFKHIFDVYLKRGSFLFISSLAILGYSKLDQLMLQHIASSLEVGVFSVGILPVSALYFLPVVITTVLLPSMTRLKNTSTTKFNSEIRRILFVAIAAGLFLAVLMCAFAPLLIKTVFGEAYLKSVLVMQITAFSIVPVFFGTLLNIWIVNNGQEQSHLERTIFGLVINVIANILLIPDFGSVGAAIASLLAQVSTMLFMLMRYRSIWQNV